MTPDQIEALRPFARTPRDVDALDALRRRNHADAAAYLGISTEALRSRLDACSQMTNVDEETIASVAACVTHSCGYLIRRNDVGAWLVTDWLEHGEMSALHFVPNGMIRSIKTVPKTTRKIRGKK